MLNVDFSIQVKLCLLNTVVSIYINTVLLKLGNNLYNLLEYIHRTTLLQYFRSGHCTQICVGHHRFSKPFCIDKYAHHCRKQQDAKPSPQSILFYAIKLIEVDFCLDSFLICVIITSIININIIDIISIIINIDISKLLF